MNITGSVVARVWLTLITVAVFVLALSKLIAWLAS